MHSMVNAALLVFEFVNRATNDGVSISHRRNLNYASNICFRCMKTLAMTSLLQRFLEFNFPRFFASLKRGQQKVVLDPEFPRILQTRLRTQNLFQILFPSSLQTHLEHLHHQLSRNIACHPTERTTRPRTSKTNEQRAPARKLRHKI